MRNNNETLIQVVVDQRGQIRRGRNVSSSKVRVKVDVRRIRTDRREFLSEIMEYTELSVPENVEVSVGGQVFRDRFALPDADDASEDAFIRELTRINVKFEAFKTALEVVAHASQTTEAPAPEGVSPVALLHEMVHNRMTRVFTELVHTGGIHVSHQVHALLQQLCATGELGTCVREVHSGKYPVTECLGLDQSWEGNSVLLEVIQKTKLVFLTAGLDFRMRYLGRAAGPESGSAWFYFRAEITGVPGTDALVRFSTVAEGQADELPQV